MNSLEQAFDEAAGRVPAWCPTCKGPRVDLEMITWLRRGESMGECPACGGVTRPDGTSARRWTSEGVRDVAFISYVEDYEQYLRGEPDAEPAE